MDTEQIDYRHELYKRFGLDEHEIREGGKSKSGKIQWFIYVNREPIQARLDTLFFMAWNLEYFDRHIGTDYVGVTCAITINGVTRQYSGGQGLNGTSSVSEDTIKGAYTDAFKRAASMWGMGLYLQNAPQIWTEGYEKGDWKGKEQRENEAWAKFVAWYEGKPQQSQQPSQQPTGRATSPASASNGNGAPNHSQPPKNAQNGVKSENGSKPQKGAEEFPNPLLVNSIFYNKGTGGNYMVFRGKDNNRQTASSYGGREKLIEAMSFVWNDDVLNGIQKWESGNVYPIPDTLVKWEQKDDHKIVVSLTMAVPA